MARAGIGILVILLVLSAGCLSAPQKLFDWAPRSSSIGALAEPDWAPQHWWGYEAKFKSGRTLHVALIVFESGPESYLLGTNSTAGFFGLPFTGNVTREDKNPIISGDEWRLFDFPLQVGKKWEYSLYGYPAMADVLRDVTIEVPGIPSHKGFELEAYSYGQLFAKYTYSPVTKWFTHLTLYEPTNGEPVVTVKLVEHGRQYNKDYYVQVPLHVYKTQYPNLAGSESFRLVGGYRSVTALLTLRGEAGTFEATLKDPRGFETVSGEVRGQGVYLDRKTATFREGTWKVEELALGKGSLRLEVLGLAIAKGRSLVAAPSPPPGERAEDYPFVNLAALLAPRGDGGPNAGSPAGHMLGT